MPRGDGTGPMGMGQMTGRSAGFCTGNQVPGFANPIGGRGYAFGRGGGRGRGGRGYRNWYHATGLTGWQRAVNYSPSWSGYETPIQYVQPSAPTKEQEISMLKGQSQYLENELTTIQKRLSELETDKAEK